VRTRQSRFPRLSDLLAPQRPLTTGGNGSESGAISQKRQQAAKSGQWRVEMTIQLADIWGLRYYVEKRGQEVIRVQRVMPTFGI
jgi:hypothetical protein